MGAAKPDFRCTETKYSLATTPDTFAALNPNANVLWPCSLVQGKSMGSGVLDGIPVKRVPGTVTLAINASTKSQYSRLVEQPALSSMQQAENDILAEYAANGGATPAEFSSSITSIYSMEQLGVIVNASFKGFGADVKNDFTFDENTAKSHVLVQFVQQYYPMACDDSQGAAGVFDSSVTAADLGALRRPRQSAGVRQLCQLRAHLLLALRVVGRAERPGGRPQRLVQRRPRSMRRSRRT